MKPKVFKFLGFYRHCWSYVDRMLEKYQNSIAFIDIVEIAKSRNQKGWKTIIRRAKNAHSYSSSSIELSLNQPGVRAKSRFAIYRGLYKGILTVEAQYRTDSIEIFLHQPGVRAKSQFAIYKGLYKGILTVEAQYRTDSIEIFLHRPGVRAKSRFAICRGLCKGILTVEAQYRTDPIEGM